MIGKELEEFIKDETKAFEERLRAKAEELQEQMIDKSKTIWDLDIDGHDEFYLLTGRGHIEERCFNSCFDSNARDIGNAFLTKEEAKFERERRKIEAVMRRYARPFVKDEANWIIEYQYQDKEIYAYWYGNYHAGAPCFESEEIAEKVIEEIGEDRLLKYWFGVKDE
jgi:hypothetical protein